MKKQFELASSLYLPEGEIKAAMVVVHGMAEHRKRYDRFAEEMKKHGIAVLTYDQRGHGESVADESELGYFGEMDGWMRLVKDLDRIIDKLKEKLNVPIILFGHSMGSMVARCYMKRHDDKIDALILSGAPNYTPAAYAGRLVAYIMCSFGNEKKRSALLHQMAEGGFINAVENPETELDWLSYDKANIQRYMQDEKCGFTFTNRGYEDLMFLMIDMHRKSEWKKSHLDLPILFVSGKDDPCTGGQEGLNDSIHTITSSGYTQVQSIVYENARHEILNEKIAPNVSSDIVSWIQKVLI